MSLDERWFPSHLRDIGRTECLELLASHRMGRVAYCEELGPVVLPVNYVFDQDTILIHISPHSTLARNLRSARASFQIDDDGSRVTSNGMNARTRQPSLPA